jgi:hypothetical protein
MKSRVAWYVAAKRRASGMTVVDLAARLGYRNPRKGVRRLVRFEHDGQCSDTMLVRLADALCLDYSTMLELCERDKPAPVNGKR